MLSSPIVAHRASPAGATVDLRLAYTSILDQLHALHGDVETADEAYSDLLAAIFEAVSRKAAHCADVATAHRDRLERERRS